MVGTPPSGGRHWNSGKSSIVVLWVLPNGSKNHYSSYLVKLCKLYLLSDSVWENSITRRRQRSLYSPKLSKISRFFFQGLGNFQRNSGHMGNWLNTSKLFGRTSDVISVEVNYRMRNMSNSRKWVKTWWNSCFINSRNELTVTLK